MFKRINEIEKEMKKAQEIRKRTNTLRNSKRKILIIQPTRSETAKKKANEEMNTNYTSDWAKQLAATQASEGTETTPDNWVEHVDWFDGQIAVDKIREEKRREKEKGGTNPDRSKTRKT